MKVTSLHVGEGISLKNVIKIKRSAIVMRHPLILQEKTKYICVFPFGVIVFWDFSQQQQQAFISTIDECIEQQYAKPRFETETVQVGREFEIGDHLITVPNVTHKIIAVISLVLSRSLVLDKHLQTIHSLIENFQPFGSISKSKSPMYVTSKRLLNMVGDAMSIRQSLTVSVSMLDTPDIVWNDSVLSEFYKELLEEYEIELRYKQLTSTIELLMQQSEFLLHLIENRRTFWLEVIIIVLIAVEIVLFVYDLWLK